MKNEKSTVKTKAAKAKPGKEKEKEKEKISVPTTPQFDVTKPHWTLRIVSDGNSPVSRQQLSRFPRDSLYSTLNPIQNS